ncbi:MAG: septation protein A [Rhodospirillaceae bacterium]|jgi:intracellular septation protein|nr:septation protein A [Rhodospirillaceae bacterium]MBT6117327.1 septation protein A [Rhodospirillaceae bacterium]
MNQLTRFLIDLGPLVVFFIAYNRADLMVATGAFMAATAVALAVSYAIERRIPKMPLVTGVVVMVFGGLTLWLANETFIKLKPTIVYTLFAVVLLGGLATGRLLLKPLFEMAFKLRDEGWRVLTLRWGVFFLAMAVLNEIVWRTMSTDVWVDLKVFGFLPITLLFALTQLPLIRRTMIEEPEGAGDA